VVTRSGEPVAQLLPVRRPGLDTSTVILLPQLENPELLPGGPLVAGTPEERAARQAHVQQAEADFEPIPFDAAAARAFGVPLYTVNPDDFAGIGGLDVVAVPHPGGG